MGRLYFDFLDGLIYSCTVLAEIVFLQWGLFGVYIQQTKTKLGKKGTRSGLWASGREVILLAA